MFLSESASSPPPLGDARPLLHLISVGSSHLMVTFWLDADADLLHLRLTRETEAEAAVPLVVEELAVPGGGLCDGEWHHVGITVGGDTSRQCSKNSLFAL